MMILLHLSKQTCGICIALRTKEPFMASKLEVYKDLQQRIITNDIAPGESLNLKGLMEHYQIGRTPLREILRELQRDGLIEIIPKLGTRVTLSDIHELKKIVQVRRRLEGLVGLLAAENFTREQFKKIKAMVQKIEELDPADEDALEMFTHYDMEIHQTLYESTRNEVLTGIISQLQKRTSKFWHQMGFTFEEFVNEVKDFKKVLNAFEKRDADRAAKALENHIDHFVKKVKGHIL